MYSDKVSLRVLYLKQQVHAMQEEYSYGREPKVIRLEHGVNQGITELVLREY